jgi:hypothetical protein
MPIATEALTTGLTLLWCSAERAIVVNAFMHQTTAGPKFRLSELSNGCAELAKTKEGRKAVPNAGSQGHTDQTPNFVSARINPDAQFFDLALVARQVDAATVQDESLPQKSVAFAPEPRQPRELAFQKNRLDASPRTVCSLQSIDANGNPL